MPANMRRLVKKKKNPRISREELEERECVLFQRSAPLGWMDGEGVSCWMAGWIREEGCVWNEKWNLPDYVMWVEEGALDYSILLFLTPLHKNSFQHWIFIQWCCRTADCDTVSSCLRLAEDKSSQMRPIMCSNQNRAIITTVLYTWWLIRDGSVYIYIYMFLSYERRAQHLFMFMK